MAFQTEMAMFAKRLSIEKFAASDGTLLYGLLALPEHGWARGAVVHVHGLGGSFYGSTGIEELSRAFTKAGIAFFSIQTRGSYIIEEFTKKRGSRHLDFLAGAALERFEDCVYDIDGAVQFLRAKGFRRLVLEGHSTGCQKTLFYASKKHRRGIAGLVLLAPVDDYNFDSAHCGKRFKRLVALARSIEKKKGGRNALMPSAELKGAIIGAKRFLSTSDPSRPEGRALNYRLERMEYVARTELPILAVFAEDDMYMKGAGITPRYAAARLKANSKKGFESILIRGTDHGFHGKRDALARKVVEWVAGHL